MSWSNSVASVLIIIVAIFAVATVAASVAIFVQIIRQGGWRLAEPAIRRARWQMVRPWLFAGAVTGLLMGIAFVSLNSSDQTPQATPTEVITSPPTEVKSQPRDGGQSTE